ncbi:MAG: 1-acyl-sn-glycerol-3-phosphate acyltransferase [Burkholderiaceae bacterium]|nr:MAG: glycerol-3-phosphate acyltransferase [Burkholderiaceae bacterium]MBE7426924.1 1-acyl-sn-glycerol-3-phosphate acyltransferase [Ideonella sp.]MCC7287420.1 1-acyl-sn-glycerol-3-phosphate acyltransferase [Burkholderiaceae bacterium]
MSSSITVPLWLALIVALLALWALLDRLLMPSARWFIRSRANKVLDEVSQRLPIHIRPFQQVRRQAMIDRLVFDEKVQQAVRGLADAQQMPREVVLAQAQRYAREIVPAFNAYMYFRIGYWVGKKLSQSLYRVRIGSTDDTGLAAIPENATVVFVMNHRSNMDYIIASYLAAERAALSYAVGEWARLWGLQQLIRAMGAYFVRRDSKDELYRRVLERYIAMATEAGVTQAVYPEGGLTRDGRLREPRFGVLDYMLRGWHHNGERDLVFVPLGLNYDRVLEDRTQLLAGSAMRRGRLRALANTLRFLGNQLWLLLRSRWHRMGYACVNFGTPVSVRAWAGSRGIRFEQLDRERRHAEVAALGHHLMAEVGRLVPVLPVPLVATALLEHPTQPRSLFDLKAAVARLVGTLESRGARLYVPRQDWDYAVDAGLRMLRLRHLVDEADGLYAVRASETPLLSYYANSIAHLLHE